MPSHPSFRRGRGRPPLKSGIRETSATFRCPQLNKYGEKIDHWVSIYPYDENALFIDKTDASYTIQTEFPAIQKYSKGSFGSGASPMMAVTKEGDLSFKNVGAAIKLRIKNHDEKDVVITKIEATTTTKRKLAGEAHYTMGINESDVPIVTLTENAVGTITLDCGSGVKLSSSEVAEFIFALPPMTGDNKFQEKELLFHVYNDKNEYTTIIKQDAFSCYRSKVTTIGQDGYEYSPSEGSVDIGIIGNTPSEPDAPKRREVQSHIW